MAQKDNSFGALFGKAKKWATEELKNAKRVGGSPQEHNQAKQANEERLDQLQRDARQTRDDAIVEALLPQGVKDWRDDMERNRIEQEAGREQRKREERAARAGRASMSTTGAVTGSAEGLAVTTEAVEHSGGLFVCVEPVDPIPMVGGTFNGFTFEIPNGGVPATYHLTDDGDFDPMQYAFGLEEDNEGWFFHPSYGPGTITVAAGVANVDLTFGSAGSQTIHVVARVAIAD